MSRPRVIDGSRQRLSHSEGNRSNAGEHPKRTTIRRREVGAGNGQSPRVGADRPSGRTSTEIKPFGDRGRKLIAQLGFDQSVSVPPGVMSTEAARHLQSDFSAESAKKTSNFRTENRRSPSRMLCFQSIEHRDNPSIGPPGRDEHNRLKKPGPPTLKVRRA